MPSPVGSPSERRALDETLRRAMVATALTGVAFALAAAGLGWGPVSVLGGSLVAVANLFSIALIVRALLGRQGKPWGWALVGVVKMVGLFGLVAWLLRHEIVRAIPFALGYASLPVGLTLAALFAPPYDPTATDA
jgi:hypothetical protein